MARRHIRTFVRAAPKTKLWIGFGLGNITATGGAKTVLGSLNAAALASRPFTILRTRLDIRMESDQIAAVEKPIGSVGIILVTDQATAIGITAVPGPETDSDADWFVHQGTSVNFIIIGAGTGVNSDGGHHWGVDSKAMRKVTPNKDVLVVSELLTSVGAVYGITGRMLVQLH